MNAIYATWALINELLAQFGHAILWIFFIGAVVWMIRRVW